jgi:mannose/fructose/N-acetylgalactosamine-specific phosphotransferase system component IID
MQIGIDSGRIPGVLIALLLFGVVYNFIVTWIIRQGYDEGYTWMFVIGGVAVTLGGVALIASQAALLTLLAFACSGLPMALGSWWRYVQRRQAGQNAQREVL